MKLILCCDYGLDDAAATADVLVHAERDGYGEVVLVAVGGNVPAAFALTNAKKLVANLPFALPRITVVDTTAEDQPAEFLQDIHGGDGMGDLFDELPCNSVSVLSFSDWLSDLKGEYILLSLGPMTLVPAILNRGDCVKFIFMGGNIAEEPNFHGYEFNHALNRAAFSEAVKRKHVAITMDTCRNPLLNIQECGVTGDGIMHRIAMRSRELSFRTGEKGCYVWDDLAVKYLRHPDWFSLYEAKDRDGNLLTVANYTHGATYSEIIEL